MNNFPGKKILLKGNHDYWWETVTKMKQFLVKNRFENIYFLYNNCIETEAYFVCGTRYWSNEDGEDNEKIFKREIQRAKLSLKEAKRLNDKKEDGKKPTIMVTHYPPDERIIEELKEYDIKYWIYAHIHSNYENFLIEIAGIETYLTSCDFLDFKLKKL